MNGEVFFFLTYPLMGDPLTSVFVSQLPVASWHEVIGDPTIADAICDRIIHNAHRIELKGDSVRKVYLNN